MRPGGKLLMPVSGSYVSRNGGSLIVLLECFTVEITGTLVMHPHLHILVYSNGSRLLSFAHVESGVDDRRPCLSTQPKFSVVLGHLVKYINDPGFRPFVSSLAGRFLLRGLRLYQSFGKFPKVPHPLLSKASV